MPDLRIIELYDEYSVSFSARSLEKLIMLEFLITIIGTIASGIAIYEFVTTKFDEPENIERVFEKPNINDSEVVLSVNYKKTNKSSNSIEQKIGEYAKKIGVDKFDEFYYVHNPRGTFIASKLSVVYFLSLSLLPYIFIAISLLVPDNRNFFSPESNYPWGLYLFVFTSILITPLGFYQSFKSYKRVVLIKNYLTFLSENHIRIGYRITQARKKYEEANKPSHTDS